MLDRVVDKGRERAVEFGAEGGGIGGAFVGQERELAALEKDESGRGKIQAGQPANTVDIGE